MSMIDLTRSGVQARAIPHSVAIPKVLTYLPAILMASSWFASRRFPNSIQWRVFSVTPGRAPSCRKLPSKNSAHVGTRSAPRRARRECLRPSEGMIPNPSGLYRNFRRNCQSAGKVRREPCALDTTRCEIAIRRGLLSVEHGSDIRQRVGTELAVWFGCTSSDFRGAY